MTDDEADAFKRLVEATAAPTIEERLRAGMAEQTKSIQDFYGDLMQERQEMQAALAAIAADLERMSRQ